MVDPRGLPPGALSIESNARYPPSSPLSASTLVIAAVSDVSRGRCSDRPHVDVRGSSSLKLLFLPSVVRPSSLLGPASRAEYYRRVAASPTLLRSRRRESGPQPSSVYKTLLLCC